MNFMVMKTAVHIPVLTWNGNRIIFWMQTASIYNVPHTVRASVLMMACVYTVRVMDNHWLPLI